MHPQAADCYCLLTDHWNSLCALNPRLTLTAPLGLPAYPIPATSLSPSLDPVYSLPNPTGLIHGLLLIQLHSNLMLLKEETSCSIKCRSLLSEATVTNESLLKHVPLGSLLSPSPADNLPDTQCIWNSVKGRKAKPCSQSNSALYSPRLEKQLI